MNIRLIRIGVVAALSSATGTAFAEVQVVATTPSLAALAREVGGDRVAVTALSRSNQDPHYVDARPSLLITLHRAQLLVVNGLELEVGWLPPLQQSARNADIQVGASGYLDASQLVQRLAVPTAKIDRAMGDVHPGGNPHFTLDPRQGARIAKGIATRLAELDPEGATEYRARAEKLSKALLELAAQARAKVAALPEPARRVVVYHDSLVYLCDWLGLEQLATLEPRPGIPPDPSHVAAVLKLMRAASVRGIMQEEYYPRGSSDTLAKLANARVAALPGGARFEEGKTYGAYVQALAETVVAALAAPPS